MLRAPEPVLMVIADVSGYTRYLAGTELDHAQDVLADLLETIATSLEPPLTLLAVEGDACFVFAPADSLGGQQLLDVLDACYFSFRRRLRDVSQATSCRCQACIRIPDLDLKIVAHVGQAIRQRVGRQETLAGPDVIAAHRLLKNGIAEILGHRGYAFFSEACARRLGLLCGDMGMLPHVEVTDVGEIRGYVADLAARWVAEDAAGDGRLSPDQVLERVEMELAVPPAVAWTWLTDPAHRMRWQGATAITQANERGRVEVGTVNHCMHGPETLVERIVQWRPFHDLVVSTRIPGAFDVRFSYQLEPIDDGTRVTMLLGGLDDAAAITAWRTQVGPVMMADVTAAAARLTGLVQEPPETDVDSAVAGSSS